MAVGVQQQQRRATEAVWLSSGKILAAGEIGFATDSKIIKMGDGVNTWDNLSIPYDGRYLPIGGKAADSEMLDGISSGGFLLVGDATTVATADKVVKRDSNGRAKVATGVSTDDVVNYAQMVAADTVVKQTLISRTVTAAFTLALTDTGKTILAGNASYAPYAANIPLNSSVAFVVGSVVKIITTDKGGVTLTPAAGVTLTGPTALPGGVSSVELTKTATDAWLVTNIQYSPGPVLRRKVKVGTGGQTLIAGFNKIRLDGANSGTSTNNADTLGTNEQYNAATDLYKCNVRRSGWYDVMGQVTINDAISGRAYCTLYVNGSAVPVGKGGPKGSVLDTGYGFNDLIQLNVGDYVEMYGFQEVASSATVVETNDSPSFFAWAWRRPL